MRLRRERTTGSFEAPQSALAAGRLLAAQLFDIRPSDPLTYAAVAAALLVTGLAACAVPAFRAMRMDPLVALREE